MRRSAIAMALLASTGLGAQASPSTDVWVIPMSQPGRVPVFGEPANVTHRAGYDNQPSFTPAGDAVLYTVIGAGGASDISRFTLREREPEQLTFSPESEYSATVTPDGRSYSVIRVEADSTQRLWRFPLGAQGPPTLVLEDLRPVGYHVWGGDHTLALFVLGDPATLQIADDRAGKAEVVAADIGRALAKVPGRDAVTFVQQVKDSLPWIAELDVRTKSVRRVAQSPPGADYHAWTPNGALLTAAGSRIFVWTDGRWDVAADLGRWGARGISRLVASPKGDWLAFVAEDDPSP